MRLSESWLLVPFRAAGDLPDLAASFACFTRSLYPTFCPRRPISVTDGRHKMEIIEVDRGWWLRIGRGRRCCEMESALITMGAVSPQVRLRTGQIRSPTVPFPNDKIEAVKRIF
jgi:hypothetical protein